MLAQRLRYSVTLEQRGTALNAYGESAPVWTTFATVRAGIEPYGGRETLLAGAAVGEQNVRIVLRHIDGLTPQMRVNWNGRYYDIKAMAEADQARRLIELTCTQGVSNG